MSKKSIIVAVFMGCLVLVAFYFLRQTKGVYYKSYSPDGQYSRYASVNNYFSYDGPFAKICDMRKINGITYLGLVLNTFILAFTGASEQYKILFIPTAIAYMLCVLGVILILINRTKVGRIIFI